MPSVEMSSAGLRPPGLMRRHFILNIVTPSALTLALFLGLIFGVLLPAMERNIIDRKKEMLRELSRAVSAELEVLFAREKSGALTSQAAQQAAINHLREARYGPDGKEYFWVINDEPRMVMHPYRPDLVGTNLSGYADPSGKKLFVQSVGLVREHGDGFVEYLWQWKDNPERIVPKLTYVRGFKPWGWVIGTGVYLDDVRAEMRSVTRRALLISLVISLLVAALLGYLARQGFLLERQRAAASAALRESEEKYRALVEGSAGGLLLTMQSRPVFANQVLLRWLDYTAAELEELTVDRIVAREQHEFASPGILKEQPAALMRKDGGRIRVLLSASPADLGGKPGEILSFRPLTAPRHDDESAARLLAELRQAQPGGIDPMAEAIRAARSVDDLRDCRERMLVHARAWVETGAHAPVVMRHMSQWADLALARLVELETARLGPPPAAFAFLVLGSEARGEQTLATDQDNAILYADGADGDATERQAWFLKLGERVCDALDNIGYRRCAGGVMASNPKWCQPLSRWREYFTECIVSPSAQALLDVNVFFDFRGACGNGDLVQALRRHLGGLLDVDRPEFFFHLAQSTLQFRPPVGFFGRIRAESTDGHREALNLKSALVPLVNFARIYALKHRVAALNSLERLHRLRDLQVLLPSSHDELAQDFGVLSDMRLRHQVAQWRRGVAPDNLVDLEDLTHLDETLLRRIFADIGVFQARLQTDFARTS